MFPLICRWQDAQLETTMRLRTDQSVRDKARIGQSIHHCLTPLTALNSRPLWSRQSLRYPLLPPWLLSASTRLDHCLVFNVSPVLSETSLEGRQFLSERSHCCCTCRSDPKVILCSAVPTYDSRRFTNNSNTRWFVPLWTITTFFTRCNGRQSYSS